MGGKLFRNEEPIPLDIRGSEGSYLVCKKGKRYLDFMMGWCVGNAGWNKKTIQKQLSSFKGPTYVNPSYKYEQWEKLAEKLVSLMPNKKATCFKATGGTEAVELALKISKAHNRRKKFIAFKGAYHGQSLACLALVGLHEKKFGPYPKDFIRIVAGNWEKAAAQTVKALKKGNVSAFISEPIICNLGVAVPPKEFFEEVQEACNETNTVLIMDEVATGFGRTGKWFGFQHYGLKPDIVTAAKGLSSGYAAIGAAIASPKIAKEMQFDFSNYSTFGWHPLSTKAAIASIDYIKRKKLVQKAEKSGKYLMQKLSGFCRPEGKGLCIGFRQKSRKIVEQCRKDGLIISDMGSRVTLFPALDVSKKDMDKAVEIIKKNY